MTGIANEITNPIKVSFSGGKDSVATYLYLARDLGFRDVECVFCDTGHESEITHNYLETLRREHGFPIVHLQPLMRDLWVHPPDRADLDEPLTMERLAIHKEGFPRPMKRHCTNYLKMAPFRRWLRESTHETTVLASGVRAEESSKRAQQSPVHWDEYMERWRWLPIHRWTVAEVFACHQRHRVPENPLYRRGASRVGCYPCINAKKEDLRQLALREPSVFDRLRVMEQTVTNSLKKAAVATFFHMGTTSRAYRSTVDPNSGLHVPTAEDVRRWALGEPPRFKEGEIFLGEEQYEADDIDGDDLGAPACSSPYGLCE